MEIDFSWDILRSLSHNAAHKNLSVLRTRKGGLCCFLCVTDISLILFILCKLVYLFIYLFVCLFYLFRATPMAYGSSQARGWIRMAVTGLHHSHSKARSELCLKPTPQLTGTPDPLSHSVRPGILDGFSAGEPQQELLQVLFNFLFNLFSNSLVV